MARVGGQVFSESWEAHHSVVAPKATKAAQGAQQDAPAAHYGRDRKSTQENVLDELAGILQPTGSDAAGAPLPERAQNPLVLNSPFEKETWEAGGGRIVSRKEKRNAQGRSRPRRTRLTRSSHSVASGAREGQGGPAAHPQYLVPDRQRHGCRILNPLTVHNCN